MTAERKKLASLIISSKSMISINKCKKITYDDLGKITNFAGINFHKWANSTNSPKSVIAILNLLSNLEDKQILQLIEMWRNETHNIQEEISDDDLEKS